MESGFEQREYSVEALTEADDATWSGGASSAACAGAWGRRRLKRRLRAGRLASSLHRGVSTRSGTASSLGEARWMGGGAVRRAGRCAQPPLGGGAVRDAGAVESRDRGDDAEPEPLAREHPPALRGAASDEVTEHRGIWRGHDRSASSAFDRHRRSGSRAPSTRCGESEYLRLTTGSRCRTCSLAIRVAVGCREAVGSACGAAGISRWPRSQLRLELEFLPFLRRNGLPRPRLNVWLRAGREVNPGRLPLALVGADVNSTWLRRASLATRVAFREDTGSRQETASAVGTA